MVIILQQIFAKEFIISHGKICLWNLKKTVMRIQWLNTISNKLNFKQICFINKINYFNKIILN